MAEIKAVGMLVSPILCLARLASEPDLVSDLRSWENQFYWLEIKGQMYESDLTFFGMELESIGSTVHILTRNDQTTIKMIRISWAPDPHAGQIAVGFHQCHHSG